ncbi:acyl-CoA dehydrogenase family protein [Roseomonas elaeocarpi]|uniref:Acyl-CoA dehydrogenase family protein n=1 Tax=Roseomonas elaeocarpi TaxID=907779 RepID=A0ABV6JRC5_9PROT
MGELPQADIPLPAEPLPAVHPRSFHEILPLLAERAEVLDRDGGLPDREVALLHEAGLLDAPLPRVLGGEGWGNDPAAAPALLDALRRIGRVSLPLGRLYEGHVNALRLVAGHGNPAQLREAAADIRAGRLFGVWNSEPPEGLHLDGSQSASRLRGRKIWCSGAGLVERALVTARRGDEVQMLLVPLPRGTERADLDDWHPTGMRASATGTVDFNGLAVPAEWQIGEPGGYYRQPDFSAGAWRFLAVQLGGIEAVAEALRSQMRQSGRGADPHQAARFGEVVTALETARLWVHQAAIHAEGRLADDDRTVAYVNLARGAVERAGLEAVALAQRSIGLASFMRPHPVERVIRDLATYLRQPAPDRALTSAAATVLSADTPLEDFWNA